jgi:hypothetical protein
MSDFHLNFEKECGRFRVHSYGGGSPRWVKIFAENLNGETVEINGLRMNDLPDLQYLITRLIAEVGE